MQSLLFGNVLAIQWDPEDYSEEHAMLQAGKHCDSMEIGDADISMCAHNWFVAGGRRHNMV